MNVFHAILQCTAILHSTKVYYEMQIGFNQKTTLSLDKNTICDGNETVNRISSGQLPVDTPVRKFRHGITSPYQGFKVSLLCFPVPICPYLVRWNSNSFLWFSQKETTNLFGSLNSVSVTRIEKQKAIAYLLNYLRTVSYLPNYFFLQFLEQLLYKNKFFVRKYIFRNMLLWN